MKKQEYIDIGIQAWLTPSQIEGVLCRVMGITKEKLFTLKEISSKYIYEIQKAFYDIEHGQPEEYTLETANFYGRDFFVDERVLIPRNDTELLVEEVLKKINLQMYHPESMIYIDVGTGSGCIPASIVLEMHPLKFHKVFALDISPEAIWVARENFSRYSLDQIDLRESNLLHGVFHEETLRGKSLCITANLPYIKNGDHENMDKSVIAHEPNLALYGWEETGFELYEELIKQCFQIKEIYKVPHIHLFIEIGFDQYEHSQKFLQDLWLTFEYFADSANIQRVISIYDF